MKKFWILAVILALFGLNACKKKEEQPAPQQTTQQQPTKPEEFKPAKKKNGKKGEKGQQPVPTSVKVYQEAQLVKTVNQADYATLTTTKIKVGAKQLNAITLKEFLAKNNIKSGKTVTLAGQTVSAQLTWEQANSSDLYLFVTPKKFLKIQGGKSTTAVKFPKRLESITVSASEVAAKAPDKKPAPKTNK